MRKRKALLLMYAAVFVLMLAVPILTINRVPGRISVTENRYLAEFPTMFDNGGHLNAGVKSEFETWLSDNLGFRDKFMEIAANIRVKLFHQSTSDKVEIGRDGWYFYRYDHNIELASGEFVLTDEMLEDIAKKQQRISDWYAAQGIKYLLVLTPSKTTACPEYIASGDYEIMDTPCDQLEAYLTAHTTVQVVNCKRLVVEKKTEEAQLFPKTDTHATQAGTYLYYLSMADKLNAMGDEIKPFPVTFSEMQLMGEFSAMLGAVGMLGAETVPRAMWDSTVMPVTTGTVFDELERIQQNDAYGMSYPVVMYQNDSAANGTVLIYGDSNWDEIRCLPQWLGESYRSMVLTRLRSVTPAVDDLVQPDTVIYSCGERYIDAFLRFPLNIPDLVDDLPDLPEAAMISGEDYGQWVANQGICLDICNNVNLAGSTTISIDLTSTDVKLYGWAADFCNDAPFRELYLRVGDALMRCEYHFERTSVVDYYQKDSLLKTGFETSFPVSYLKDGEVTEISFIGVSADGQHLYEPVTYQLSY